MCHVVPGCLLPEPSRVLVGEPAAGGPEGVQVDGVDLGETFPAEQIFAAGPEGEEVVLGQQPSLPVGAARRRRPGRGRELSQEVARRAPPGADRQAVAVDGCPGDEPERAAGFAGRRFKVVPQWRWEALGVEHNNVADLLGAHPQPRQPPRPRTLAFACQCVVVLPECDEHLDRHLAEVGDAGHGANHDDAAGHAGALLDLVGQVRVVVLVVDDADVGFRRHRLRRRGARTRCGRPARRVVAAPGRRTGRQQ